MGLQTEKHTPTRDWEITTNDPNAERHCGSIHNSCTGTHTSAAHNHERAHTGTCMQGSHQKGRTQNHTGTISWGQNETPHNHWRGHNNGIKHSTHPWPISATEPGQITRHEYGARRQHSDADTSRNMRYTHATRNATENKTGGRKRRVE